MEGKVNNGSSAPVIAVIGAGIGGTSCCYFLRNYFPDGVSVHIYEENEFVGGRLSTFADGALSFETGGSVIHQRNKYMNQFQKELGLTRKPVLDKSTKLGVYQDNALKSVLDYRNWFRTIQTYLLAILRYGFSFVKLRFFIADTMNSFDHIYKLQEDGVSFDTVGEMLSAMDSKFVEYQRVSCAQGMKNGKFLNADDSVVNDLVLSSIRVNYGQSLKIPLFVGAVSVAGMIGSLWSVAEGNKMVPQRILDKLASDISIHRRKVKKIRLMSDERYCISTDVEDVDGVYDAVIIATPLTRDHSPRIEFEGFEPAIEVKGKYHRTVATFVKGNLKESFRGNALKGYTIIINNEKGDFFNSAGKVKPIGADSKNEDANVWKVFSDKPLSSDELDTLFENGTTMHVSDWLAYPDYNELGRDESFKLRDKLFYANAVEWAASAMEMAVIGARNVALLTREAFKQK